MLRASGIGFGYRRDSKELRDVSIVLDKGRTIMLGPNGAGKSTLIKVLAGAQPHTGSIELDGVMERSRRKTRRYRQAIGWLPQGVVPFPGLTVSEHVAYAGWLKGVSPKRARRETAAALERVGLANERDERADRLSGGQTRRLGIAAVLVHSADYILLDEPTAGLDPEERDRLIELLGALGQEHSLCIATHDVDGLVTDGSHVVVMRDGKITFDDDADAFVHGADPSRPLSESVRQAYREHVAHP